MYPKSIPKNYSNEKLLNIKDFSCNMNKEILKATIKFLKIYERFNGPIFLSFLKNVCPDGIYFSYIFSCCCFFKFRYMYRTCFKGHVTFSKFYVLFSLVLAFSVSYNLQLVCTCNFILLWIKETKDENKPLQKAF